MTRRPTIVFLLGLCLATTSARAQPDADSLSAGPLFEHQETLRVEIEGPLSTLLRERSDSDYYEGKIRFVDMDGTDRELSLKFRARGNFRRRTSTCRFPPVRLNFDRSEVPGTVFAGQNILKLVTHCRPRNATYQQYVLREYLAYKIFEAHTPYHFRTRLLHIDWIDTEKPGSRELRYGFLIEHKRELAARLRMSEAEVQRSSYDRLDRQQATIVAVFQYLIGNTDYSMVAGAADENCCHNGILMTADGETHVPIPYDFDFSGIVNARYAAPNPRFGIPSVTTRLYRGHCSFNEEVDETLELFRDKRDIVMALFDSQEGLSRTSRNRARSFVARFYEDIANPRRIDSRFIDACI